MSTSSPLAVLPANFTPSLPDHTLGGFSPVMFYHIPRTGGLSFYSLLRVSLSETIGQLQARGAPVAVPLMDRFDREDAEARGDIHDYALVATHNAFGFHRRFRHAFLFVTIGRHPVARVASDYAYNCLRRDTSPDPQAFAAFFRAESAINRATKQLAGQQDGTRPVTAGGLERALDHLRQRFYAYVPDDQVTALTSHFLSRFHIANVLSDRINATRPRDRLDVAPWAGEIAALNHLDVALFEAITAAPRLPTPAPAAAPALHPLTVIFQQSPDPRKAAGRSRVMDTGQLLRILQDDPARAADLGWFFGPAAPGA